MLKIRHLVALGCCLSSAAMASTIEYMPDEEWVPAKYSLLSRGKSSPPKAATQKVWRPTHPVGAKKVVPVVKQTYPQKTTIPAKDMALEKDAPVQRDIHRWSATGSIGYTQFQQAGDGSGGALLGRFAIGRDFYNTEKTRFGLELGVQNGNRMSIAASQDTLDALGGLPVWTTVKPMVDFLATYQVAVLHESPAFVVLKGGAAYRQWEAERQSINNLSQIAGEIQAGIGVAVVERATLSLLYQGIYGANPDFTVNTTPNQEFNGTGHVSNIPVQNGVLLSLSILL